MVFAIASQKQHLYAILASRNTIRQDIMLIAQVCEANLMAFVHMVYYFVLDLNRFMHFAFALCIHFVWLKGAWPVRNWFIAAATAAPLEQCMLPANQLLSARLALHIRSLTQSRHA